MKTQPKVTCPFCEGTGCCNCEYSGKVPYGEGCIFASESEAINHDPGISYFDLKLSKALVSPPSSVDK